MAEDRFSKQSSAYAIFRPEYPDALFDFLVENAPGRNLVWDCATGTGQAARSLADRFDRVLATDLSENQILQASAPKNVDFKIAKAEEQVLPAGSADLITVAQALHWFDSPEFFANAKKTLKPRGIFAAWGYGFFKISPAVDAILDPYSRSTLGSYWSEKNWLLINGYRDINFPFERVQSPKLQLAVDWDLTHLQGYLASWSATQQFKDKNGSDPYALIQKPLEKAWGDATIPKKVCWELSLLVGRMPANSKP